MLNLTTPGIFFSAISLILLAYTNRFLALATLVRQLHAQYKEQPDSIIMAQIQNIRKRLTLIKWMQWFGVFALFLSVLSMLFIYIHRENIAEYVFGASMLTLLISLGLSVSEIHISVKALDLRLSDIEEGGGEIGLKK
jgi:glycerol-3-phosphate acyltransferase PlsY